LNFSSKLKTQINAGVIYGLTTKKKQLNSRTNILSIMLRDLVGNRNTDEMLQELYALYQQLQVIGWKEMRPWPEFFQTFKPPQFTAKNLEQRVTTNFLHYRSNYLAICAGVLIFQILFSPIILLTAVAIFGMYTYLLQLHKGALKIGEVVLDQNGKRYLFLGLSVFILLVSGTAFKILWAILYSLLLCGAHMIFRPRSVSSKANKAYEEMKLSGGNIFTFVPNGLYEDVRPHYGGNIGGNGGGATDDVEDPGYYDQSKLNDNTNVRKRTNPPPTSYR
jgi:hypothetical protein